MHLIVFHYKSSQCISSSFSTHDSAEYATNGFIWMSYSFTLENKGKLILTLGYLIKSIVFNNFIFAKHALLRVNILLLISSDIVPVLFT